MNRSNRLARNIGANLVAKSWAGLLWLILVPVYLHFLGAAAYGLVGLYLSLSLVMQLFDLGLSPTVTRELARAGTEPGGFGRVRNLIATAELLSWGTAGAIGLGLLLAVELTQATWMDPGALDPQQVRRALSLAGLAIAAQWPVLYYSGALSGLHKQTWIAAIGSLFTTVRGGGAVLILWSVSASVEAFFLWHTACSLAQSLTLAVALRRARPDDLRNGRPDLRSIQDVKRFAAGMSLLGLLAVVVTQADKLLLSAWLPLDKYGIYMAAAALAMVPQFIVAPVSSALLPELSRLLASGATAASLVTYRRAMAWMAVTLAPVLALALTHPHSILLAWSGNDALARDADMALSLLTAGNCLNGIMCIPYAWQIARGWPRVPVQINIVSLGVMLPVLWYGANRFGATGAATAWLVFNLCYIFMNLRFMTALAPETRPVASLFDDVLRPLAASLAVCALATGLPQPDYRPLLGVGLAATMMFAAGAALLATPTCLADVTAWLHRRSSPQK